ncbi:MAG TPA: hypothetical protein VK014_13835 [Cyclobacteriaceae bacterium]|nr:hypothetical protein [Cyclobacteriaceae bacterium]
MIRKTLIAVLTFFALGFGSQAFAQDYQTGVGLRLGVSNGLSVKHFVSDRAAVEGLLHTRWRGLMITGLYEVHQDIQDAPGLRWFYGGGAHIGTWNGKRGHPDWRHNHNGYTVFGIDGIIGLDYTFASAPINLSLDYKPAFNLTNDVGFWGDEVALSIRIAFK